MPDPEFDLDACRRRDEEHQQGVREYIPGWGRLLQSQPELDRHALLALVDRLGEALQKADEKFSEMYASRTGRMPEAVEGVRAALALLPRKAEKGPNDG